MWSYCHLLKQPSGGYERLLAPTPIVKLKVETVWAALSSLMMVATRLTVKSHPDWSLVTE